MPLAPFPDPRQIKILDVLASEPHTTDPGRGIRFAYLDPRISMSLEDFRPLAAELVERRLIASHGSDPTYGAIITVEGRDFLNDWKNKPKEEAEARKRRFRAATWRAVKVIMYLAAAAFFVALFTWLFTRAP